MSVATRGTQRSGAAARNAGYRVCATLVLVLLTGCSAETAGTPEGGPVSDPAALAGRPTLPQVVDDYQRMLAEMRAALTPLLGADGWGSREPTAPTALCQEFGTEPDTGLRTLPFTVLDRFVPEPQWDDVVTTVAQVSARHGFSAPVRVVDRPDEHHLALADRYGAELTVQDGPRVLSIGLITGCHLRE